MTIQDLLHAWELAVDDATVEQKRADETDEKLNVRAGLRAGRFDPVRAGEFEIVYAASVRQMC